MIIDNENEHLKVHEWISKYTSNGSMSIVTGYFTIGALAFLSKVTNEKIEQYRFVLGDIVSFDTDKVRALDLLNENIGIEASLALSNVAREAVAFLELEKVQAKTLEPNFCHAKVYLYQHDQNNPQNNYYILGSSNLTEAGVGMKTTNNVELNTANFGSVSEYPELLTWFEKLWNRPQAHLDKTIVDVNGKETKVNFKKYLIDEISRIFEVYTPEQIYFKILFELFNVDGINIEAEKQIVKLKDTVIYQKLYPFQQAGVKSLINMLNKHNGAILADAVGLGKTWSALAVMKAFQSDHEVILLCPKKLEQNWSQYYRRNNSLFEADQLDYVMRFHTDMRAGGLERDSIHLDYFTNTKKKLIVIDESHNLRNDTSSRYIFLVNEILKKSKGEVKVLLLSATPINNSFKDVRNQFKLMVKGDNDGFKDTLEVENLESTFSDIKKQYTEWLRDDNPRIADLYAKLKNSNFFKLTDNLLVARTRKQISNHFDNSLHFPKHKPIINKYITPLKFGDIENFAELLEKMNLNLSAYRPSFYTLTAIEQADENRNKGKKDAVLKDNVQREYFLVRMMQILMFKRLESSWYSFFTTVTNIYNHHDKALKLIESYKEAKVKVADVFILDDCIVDEIREIEGGDEELEKYTLGKKAPISIKDIDKVGNLEAFKAEIKKDKENLRLIIDNLNEYKDLVEKEELIKPHDNKLQELFKILNDKAKTENKKVIIFTVYADTATYLFNQLKKHRYNQFAMVTGSENKVWDSETEIKKHATILERFAPFTKVFREKNWSDFEKTNLTHDFASWKQWVRENDANTNAILQNPIDILIATDVLSEGQNLQDADMVINYDIHWNPVRVIQRLGRIDRIGSKNTEIQCVNFWPAKDVDDYINLKNRVSNRMSIMKFAGAEVIENFDENAKELDKNDELEARHTDNALKQMQDHISQDDLDNGANDIGFNDFSFDNFRQALETKLLQNAQALENMPHGVFSGVATENSTQQTLVALLRNRKIKDYKQSLVLTHIDMNGNTLSNNQKVILDMLNKYHTLPTSLPTPISNGEENAISELQKAIQQWLKIQGGSDDDIGEATFDVLDGFATGNAAASTTIQSGPANKLYHSENFDLLTWLIIN